ncbi:SDR family NAD(P)-dependent oxidoreductase [Hamadaea tsunoensis]|uniref:SDR family NAD(P)-dependent oxidoreductase n=1 Tax=Hamadaea tsunoensis TaxID=53368 RepID=UPI000424C5CF|nr:SDR family oxidoreductase [Hamadaea tsunoensis]
MTDLVVVTGASGALGRATVAELLGRGCRVLALDRSGETLPGAEAVRVDLTDRAAVQAAWEQVDAAGTPTALVNIAGGYQPGDLSELTENTLDAAIDINLATTLWSCQAALPRFTGGGAIVNVGSRSAVTGADPVAYSVSKAAVVRLTGLLAEQYKASGVRVNAVLPSLMDTPANRAVMPEGVLAKAVPVEAMAKVIAFLCSADAWPVSGAIIPAYGYA